MKVSRPLLLIVLVAALIIVGFAYQLRKRLQVGATQSCVSSVHAALASLDRATIEQVVKVGPEWKIVNALEADRLIQAAARSYSMDCKDWRPGNSLVDNWNRPLLIGIRNSPSNDKIDFRVWSNGPDGFSNTTDDIVSPYGATALMPK